MQNLRWGCGGSEILMLKESQFFFSKFPRGRSLLLMLFQLKSEWYFLVFPYPNTQFIFVFSIYCVRPCLYKRVEVTKKPLCPFCSAFIMSLDKTETSLGFRDPTSLLPEVPPPGNFNLSTYQRNIILCLLPNGYLRFSVNMFSTNSIDQSNWFWKCTSFPNFLTM